MPKIIITKKVTGTLLLETINPHHRLKTGQVHTLTDEQMLNADIRTARRMGWIDFYELGKKVKISQKVTDSDDIADNAEGVTEEVIDRDIVDNTKAVAFNMENKKLMNKEESAQQALNPINKDEVTPVFIDPDVDEKDDEDKDMIDIDAISKANRNKIAKTNSKKVAKKKSKKKAKKKAKKKTSNKKKIKKK